MKMSKIMKALAALLMLSVMATTAFGGTQRVEQASPQKGERYAYVWVLGSRIPQKIKISPIGTPSFSALSEWDRRQINQTGRGTVEQVLRQDPSISIRLGRPGGGF